MRYKTLFRLGVKWLGLAAMIFGVVLFVERILFLRWTFSGSVAVDLPELERLSAPTVAILLGLYLFFGGQWIVNLAIPSNRPYCPECGFDLTGQQQCAVCSECGTRIPADVLSQIKGTPGRTDEPVPPDSEEP